MTFLTRYSPARDLNRMFEPFFGRFGFFDEAVQSGTWRAPVRAEGRAELPPHRADVRQLRPHLQPAAQNGVLEIETPKKEEAKPKQIQINVGSAKAINA